MSLSGAQKKSKANATRSKEWPQWELQGCRDAQREALQVLDSLPDSTPIEAAQEQLKTLMVNQDDIVDRQEGLDASAVAPSTASPSSETEEARDNRIAAELDGRGWKAPAVQTTNTKPQTETTAERETRIAAELDRFAK